MSPNTSLSETAGATDTSGVTTPKKVKAGKTKKKQRSEDSTRPDDSLNGDSVQADKTKKKKKRKSDAAEQETTSDSSTDGVAVEQDFPQLNNGNAKTLKKKRKAESDSTDGDSSKKSKVSAAEKTEDARSSEEVAGDFGNFRISSGLVTKLKGQEFCQALILMLFTSAYFCTISSYYIKRIVIFSWRAMRLVSLRGGNYFIKYCSYNHVY